MNSLLILFIFSITAYAISNHFVYAHGPFHIYDKIRDLANRVHSNLGELFSCMICFPTWVGMIASVGNMFLFPTVKLTPFMTLLYGVAHWWIIMLFDGFFTSGIVWLIHTTQEALERSGGNYNEE